MKRLRNIETYAAAALTAAFAILSVLGDLVPVDLRWAALLAAVTLLLYRSVAAPRRSALDEVLGDRSALEESTPSLAKRLETARTLWLFAPTGINVLTPQICEALRRHVLNRQDGSVRVVVLDPSATAAIDLAQRQLDDALDFPIQHLRPSLATALDQLRTMAGWQCAGSFEYRMLDFNPGFSLMAVDPDTRDGLLVVELHGVHNEAVTSRMHVRATREVSEPWCSYWLRQYEHLWHEAKAARS